MVENGSRVDRLVSIDVVERFEALQDEVDLLKNEIKQTLIDLREYMMKDRTVFSLPEAPPVRSVPSPLPPRVVQPTGPAATPTNGHKPVAPLAPAPDNQGMNPVMLGKLIAWLGSVKKMGMSLQPVTPYLDAYETSGYLPPIIMKVLLRAMADLDKMTEGPELEFSPEMYSEYIGQLHEIICPVEKIAEQPLEQVETYLEEDEANWEQSEDYPEEAAETLDQTGEDNEDNEAYEDYVEPLEDPNGTNDTWSDSAPDADASRYNLTTIQVPEPIENLYGEDDGDLNG